MLTVNLITVGKLKEDYLRKACAEYEKRLSRYCRLNIIQLDEYKLSNNPSLPQIETGIKKEGEMISQKCRGYVIAMCIEGVKMNSEQLAHKLEKIAGSGQSEISFVIGGSYGLDDSVKKAADLKLSVSDMTFPHQLFRVMLLEQIYRAMNINSNGQYHK